MTENYFPIHNKWKLIQKCKQTFGFLFRQFLSTFLCQGCSLLRNYPRNIICILKLCPQPEIFVLEIILECSMMAIVAIWAELAGK